jgi:hypothetical protein
MSDIVVEQKGDVRWIRLNRPDRMNAYDAEMAQGALEMVWINAVVSPDQLEEEVTSWADE